MGEADTHHQITVFVNEKPVTIYRGMQVQHALISYDVTVFQACERGELRVEDGHGFRVGLGGALREGSKIYTREAGVGGRGPEKSIANCAHLKNARNPRYAKNVITLTDR